MLTLQTYNWLFTVSTSKYHHGDLYAALLQAGRAALEERGLAGLTLREAARRANVSATAPYRHFADAAALLAAIATQGVQELTATLQAADASAEGTAALIAQASAYVAFALRNPALYRLMFGTARPDGHPALANALADCYAVLNRRVAALAPPALAPDQTLACWCLVHGLASLAVDGRLPPQADTPEVLAARLAGLGLRDAG